MAVVTFYEKPGCANNTRQKDLLTAAGHQVQAHNLLTQAWTKSRLLAFFGQYPVNEWFNPAAPRVKSGDVVPTAVTADQAIDLMLAEPLLIRRPLMQVGDEYRIGFDQSAVDAWIGLSAQSNLSEDVQSCRMAAGHSCAKPA